MLINYRRTAKKISFSPNKRNRKNIIAVAIHYTGNKGDTAKNNADYFATRNTRAAGAHLFVDSKGLCAKSIPLNRTAYAVGTPHKHFLYGNSNTVSIELCNSTDGYTDAQAKKVKNLLKYIRKYCPNVRKVIRHYDVSGKLCPVWAVKNEKLWHSFLADIGATKGGDF